MKSTPSDRAVNPRELQSEKLRQILRRELTDLQRHTIISYYFRGKTLDQIARERNVNRSTVCRTLHRAEEKIKRFLSY